MTAKIVEIKKKLNFTAKNKGIKEPHKMSTSDLINALSKCKSYNICRKFKKSGLNKYVKKQNLTESGLRNAIKLQKKSLDDPRKMAKLRRIKDYENLSREDLIYTLLRTENHPIENNYMKYITNNTDDEIKAKTNNIRLALIKLGNIIPKRHRDIIRKDLHGIEKNKNSQKNKKKRSIAILLI